MPVTFTVIVLPSRGRASGDTSNTGRDAGATVLNRVIKCKNECVVAVGSARAAFNTRLARQR
jgi:hypothetical protein